jgi:hypothetical protein
MRHCKTVPPEIARRVRKDYNVKRPTIHNLAKKHKLTNWQVWCVVKGMSKL